jgi:hypothetical protein
VILCKMEKNFPPGFFNPMQHLLIHLPYEAKVGGPVQYRWMYHIERALRYLKPMVGHRARVEGSITEAFTLKEVAYFSSVYFTKEHNTNAPTVRYNVDEEPPCSDLSIFASRAQLLVVTQATILPRKKGWLPCYTCMLTLMGWINILSKCLLYIYVNHHAFNVFRKI